MEERLEDNVLSGISGSISQEVKESKYFIVKSSLT
jgi:hypothetical protein